MPVIRIPTPLRPYTGNQNEVDVAGSTVGEAMENLVFQHPGLKNHIYTVEGTLRPFVNLFLGEDSVRDLQGMNTALGEKDRLMIIPSVAGGTTSLARVAQPAKKLSLRETKQSGNGSLQTVEVS